MPELPEIETICRGLAAQLPGRTLAGVRVRQRQLRLPVDVEALQQAVGCRIERVGRRGKYVLVFLQPPRVLIFHLGMSGRLRVGPPQANDARHDHLIFALGADLELRFYDPRRFGLCFLTTPESLPHHPCLRHLGPEPLSEAFSAAYLAERGRGRRCPLKAFLLDATVVAGIGNIYASEILFAARLSPTREAGSLSLPEWERLRAAVQQVLVEAIAHHGTSIADYVDSRGQPGRFQNRLRVYGREGEPCPRDGQSIRRLVQAGRSTYYCPRCQR
ncbi:MAG: formamidopyrimidine-DNA glycosylase [Candidatus Tectimicrobiota bacterium]|nr:MAG: formamidopyrimidine-DNA glycosylase [Candidatus Tectomicrobia bacterium]